MSVDQLFWSAIVGLLFTKKMFRDTVQHTVGDKLGDKAAEEVPRFCVGDTVQHTVGD